PSVCPERTSTPPRRARNGKTWPGVTMSWGLDRGSAATLTVCARSCALMPVVTPERASMLTVNAGWYGLWLFAGIGGEREVSLVLPVLVVGEDHHPARADVPDAELDPLLRIRIQGNELGRHL